MKSAAGSVDSAHVSLETRSATQSCRKLLASHLSIYNTLNDPELDHNIEDSDRNASQDVTCVKGSPGPEYDIHFPRARLPSRVPTPDLQFSWQLLSNESVYRDARLPKKPSSSILSSTTDDKDEAVVVVSRNGGSPAFAGVMVFETDEEDPLDGETDLIANQKSFVMPQMRLLEQLPLGIVVLTNSHHADCEALVRRIRGDLGSTTMLITISPVSTPENSVVALRAADLVFVINDGSPHLVKCLESAYEPESAPRARITVINMMSVNYFINLFDLIAFMRPFQIWKTSSLHQPELVARMEDYILLENLTDSLEAHDGSASGGIDSLMDLSVSKTSAPNYKQIERRLRRELQDSVSLSSSDPLRLSSNFYHVNILYSILKKMFVSPSGHEPASSLARESKIWAFCSFALGVGLGVTLAGGAATIFGFCAGVAEEEPQLRVEAHVATPIDLIDQWAQRMADSSLFDAVTRWWDSISGSFQLFSSHMVVAVKGGFDKVLCMAQVG